MQGQINVLTDAIERLEAELGSGPTKARRNEIGSVASREGDAGRYCRQERRISSD